MMPLKSLFFSKPVFLEDILGRGKNSFELIRLVASLSVVFGHAFALHPSNGHAEPIGKLIQFDYIGTVAVFMFLFVSGIFVTASYDRSRSLLRFAILRIGRIWPALIVCILITVFIVGPLVTSLTISEYFSSHETWNYLLTNIKLMEVRYNLPGVFDYNWYNDSVNGSLWILPVLVRCYALVAVLGLIGCLRHWKWVTLAVLGIISVYFFSQLYFAGQITYYIFQSYLMGGLTPLGVRCYAFFLAGMLAYSYRKVIILDARLSVFFFALWLSGMNTGFSSTLFYLFLAYSVLVLASSKISKRVVLPGDYSYGIYIYGFLIQQLLAFKLPLMTAYESLALSLPLSCSAGFVSWHAIEKPVLISAKKLREKK